MAGSSVSSFVTTLIVNGVLFTVFILIFILLKGKYTRVYQPRSTVETVPKNLKADPQPKGAFAWFFDLLRKPDSYIIEKAGVDGYFFLRYLKVFTTVGIGAGVIVWPILFAVNATGGAGQSGFDIISYSNITVLCLNLEHCVSITYLKICWMKTLC
ncbi:unnamed protein product [Ambrosiozyma monospora]|uniref:Unnamed protein product n=1 Tax=Ambrosiozyma monospora TaxID=43982 RepID=A0ACB5TTA3_AMBMO|nr:unnamed protein product [Ambrosiozyma monospora]